MHTTLLFVFIAGTYAAPGLGSGYNYAQPSTLRGLNSGLNLGGFGQLHSPLPESGSLNFGGEQGLLNLGGYETGSAQHLGSTLVPSLAFNGHQNHQSYHGGLSNLGELSNANAGPFGFGGFSGGISNGFSSSLSNGLLNGGFSGLSSGHASLIGGHAYGQEPLINKHFYLHSAPEDHSEITKTKHITVGRPQKNYRVIFIKAPSSNTANAQISVGLAPQEEKTVIYVLSQKQHDFNINNIVSPTPTEPSKPEVFFIKYKTPEEALHAQQHIQAQYDSLGGSSQITDAGIAPVSSVIGALGQNLGEHNFGGHNLDGHHFEEHNLGGLKLAEHNLGGHKLGGHHSSIASLGQSFEIGQNLGIGSIGKNLGIGLIGQSQGIGSIAANSGIGLIEQNHGIGSIGSNPGIGSIGHNSIVIESAHPTKGSYLPPNV